MEIAVALVQMAVACGNPARNGEVARSQASQAAALGASLLVLPELWLTGYDLDKARACATPLDEGLFTLMAELARTHGLYVVGTALEANSGGLPFNTAALYAPHGARLAVYRKVHLFPPLGEVEHMTAGADLPVFDLPWGRTAIAICYDLRFPEMWRRYRAAGAEVILIPSEWPARRIEHWRLLLRARAVENQLFVLGCNRAGSDVDGEFGGHSAAVDPWGRVLVEGNGDPGLFLATLNLDEVGCARQQFPWFEDRRPDLYG